MKGLIKAVPSERMLHKHIQLTSDEAAPRLGLEGSEGGRLFADMKVSLSSKVTCAGGSFRDIEAAVRFISSLDICLDISYVSVSSSFELNLLQPTNRRCRYKLFAWMMMQARCCSGPCCESQKRSAHKSEREITRTVRTRTRILFVRLGEGRGGRLFISESRTLLPSPSGASRAYWWASCL